LASLISDFRFAVLHGGHLIDFSLAEQFYLSLKIKIDSALQDAAFSGLDLVKEAEYTELVSCRSSLHLLMILMVSEYLAQGGMLAL
jgi:hypothetical protein